MATIMSPAADQHLVSDEVAEQPVERVALLIEIEIPGQEASR